VNNYEIKNIDIEQKGKRTRKKGIGQERKREKGLKFST
jgi:hypothetical protein